MAEIGKAEIGMHEIGILEICKAEICPAEVCTTEVCTAEIGTAEIGAVEIGMAEIGMAEICTAEIRFTHQQIFSTLIPGFNPFFQYLKMFRIRHNTPFKLLGIPRGQQNDRCPRGIPSVN